MTDMENAVGDTPLLPICQMSFDAGASCATDGPTDENCSWVFFVTPGMTASWMRGKAQAEHNQRELNRETAAGDDR